MSHWEQVTGIADRPRARKKEQVSLEQGGGNIYIHTYIYIYNWLTPGGQSSRPGTARMGRMCTNLCENGAGLNVRRISLTGSKARATRPSCSLGSHPMEMKDTTQSAQTRSSNCLFFFSHPPPPVGLNRSTSPASDSASSQRQGTCTTGPFPRLGYCNPWSTLGPASGNPWQLIAMIVLPRSGTTWLGCSRPSSPSWGEK